MKSYLGVLTVFFCGLFIIAGISLYFKPAITGDVVSDQQIEDINAPYVEIIYPSDGQKFNEAIIDVYGSAKDNNALSQVKLRLNEDGWMPVGTELWTTKISLIPGKNIIYVQAFDSAGNPSSVSAVTIFYNK